MTAACCFPKSVSDLSLSLVPCRLYWPCLEVYNWGELFQNFYKSVWWFWFCGRWCLMRRRCRVADGRNPRLLSSSPGSLKSQFFSHLYKHSLLQSSPSSIFSLWVAFVIESLLRSWNMKTVVYIWDQLPKAKHDLLRRCVNNNQPGQELHRYNRRWVEKPALRPQNFFQQAKPSSQNNPKWLCVANERPSWRNLENQMVITSRPPQPLTK